MSALRNPRPGLLDGALSHRTLPGRLVRMPLRLLPSGSVVRVLRGPGRGLRWILGAGPHSCWLGINESAKRELLAGLLRPGDVFFDIGAHVGSYTMIAARLVRSHGRVIAFEPVRRNRELLQRHLELNHLDNVTVLDSAVAARCGTLRFELAVDTLQGHIAADGSSEVSAVSLDDFIESSTMRPPSCIKIDVEGAELEVLLGARVMLERHRPHLFVAAHSEQLADSCKTLLEKLGYLVGSIADDWELYAQPRAVTA